MRKLLLSTLVFLGSLLLVAACAPVKPATPTQPPAGVPTTPVPTLVPLSVAQPSATTDAGWSDVVATAKKEGKLTIYSFTFIGDLGLALASAFKQSQGIDLEVVAGSGSVFMERLKAEARSHSAVGDILEGATTNATLSKQQGLTQTYGYLPVLNQTGVWVIEPRVDPESQIIYYNPIIQNPWANSNLVNSSNEPHSWRDFLDLKWKGKILVSDPAAMPINSQIYIMLSKYLGFDEQYFRSMAQQDLIVVPTARDRASRLARGEAALAWVDTMASVSGLVVEGAPLRPLDMKEGVQGSAQAVNIVAGAPHPNAARVFINWLLSPEGQTANAKIRSILPLRTDVPDFTPPNVRVKFTKVIPLTPKDDEDSAKAMREGTLARFWGRQ